MSANAARGLSRILWVLAGPLGVAATATLIVGDLLAGLWLLAMTFLVGVCAAAADPDDVG